MIVTERYLNDMIKTYSDSGFLIMQDGTGILYSEAIDPEFMNRTYSETDIPIEVDDGDGESAEEILNILLGEPE